MALCYYSLIGNAQQFFNNQGVVLAGGKLFTYLAGTNTPRATYQSAAGVTPNLNPMILNAAGFVQAPVWIPGGTPLKFILQDANGVQQWVWDNVSGANDVTGVVLNEWQITGLTPTFVNATTFTVTGNQLSTFTVGRRVQAFVTAGTVYGTIASATFGAGVTSVVLTMDAGSLDAGLSSALLSFLNSANPSVPNILPYPFTAKGLVSTANAVITGALTVGGNAAFGGTLQASSQPAWNLTQFNVQTTGTTVIFDGTPQFALQGGVTVASNTTVTVPVTGKYLVSFGVGLFNSFGGTVNVTCSLVNGLGTAIDLSSSDWLSLQAGGLGAGKHCRPYLLSAGATLRVDISGGFSGTLNSHVQQTFFSGVLLAA